ncbi:hypothetical protein [Microcoleus sp. LEGE 07076]|uniref:hypothetical protein n=1 Tax=Microcoleus sp. LEGE 07076 TaxID=915322 RepID=UPI001881F1D0|nr:hypothetical protein [Microcoleus sp. LEGE 07076]
MPSKRFSRQIDAPFFTCNKWGVTCNKHRPQTAEILTPRGIDAPQPKNRGLTDRPRCVDCI